MADYKCIKVISKILVFVGCGILIASALSRFFFLDFGWSGLISHIVSIYLM